jgi:hypothetical protein
LEKPPDNEVAENSGAAIPLQSPNEEICEIVSVDVDGIPALFFHSSTPSEKVLLAYSSIQILLKFI